jgi:diguanylate cyclase (GGDEF)-like protein
MKVLIIDDILPNALLVQQMIKRGGEADTQVFTSARAALAWCEENEPDLFIVDYIMPDMDGLEFLQAVRAQPRLADIPLVMVTAEQNRDALYKALAAGANDFLRKPVDPIELAARTRNMLRLRSRQLALAEANRQLHLLSITDPLTGVFNRRHFTERLSEEYQRARRFRHPLAVALIDADHFKQVNDRYGHQAGDEVLKALAGCCSAQFRAVDVFGRLGGEEFGVVMPETDDEQARIACERLRETVAATGIAIGAEVLRRTVSIGVSELRPDDTRPEAALMRADAALYDAKRGGRNQVRLG